MTCFFLVVGTETAVLHTVDGNGRPHAHSQHLFELVKAADCFGRRGTAPEVAGRHRAAGRIRVVVNTIGESVLSLQV